MRIGIKVKLAVILSGLLFISTFTLGVILILHQRSSLEAQMRSMASTIADQFSGDIKIPLLQKDSLTLNMQIQNIMKYPGISDAYILNEGLQIEGHKDLSEVGLKYEKGADIIAKSTGPAPWVINDGHGLITIASPVIFKGTTVGYTVLSFSNDFIKERVWIAVTSVLIIAVFAIMIVSFASIPIATTLLRPVMRLFKGTQEVALGNFDYRIPDGGKDEIGDLISSFNRMASELKKKELLKGAFNRYVSHHVADEILKDPERIRLGGDRRNVTVFFADIRDFTSLSRTLLPEETVELLNRYFTLITEIIFRFEGTVDKFIGDAVMSVFGSPIKADNHLEQGIKAAVAIKKAVEKVNSLSMMHLRVKLNIGIGLDSGEVIVGNMGSQMRMEYTAVGEAVNLASRLAGLAKGGDIFIGEEVYDSVRESVDAERMIGVGVKGLSTPLTLYNVTGLKGQWRDEVEEVLESVFRSMEERVLK